ncbi:hypothetical protein L2E82_08315 [Cichorium intybus]|uniref:Uncharacterized protein n=1 Tax=Cichorium intybus TaxID=13427 RepID=A0ACB9G6T8_CICIN|nr:hypothetical protein L2E82_08315 [Cichorium intybus]
MDSYSDSSSSVDAEDNAFYQELTRQILMLTDEDDDDMSTYRKGVTEIRRKPVVYGGAESRPVAKNYYNWSETVRSPAPSWMESLWSNSGGGTGVFIPSGVAAYVGGGKKSGRRRYNNKRKSNDRGRTYLAGGQKIHG